MKQASIPDTAYDEHRKFSNWHLGKVSKICRSRMFPCSICRKKQFAGHVSEYLCRWLGWVYRCEDVLSILLGFFFNCKYHQQVDDVTQHSCDFFCVHITYFILIYHSPLLLFYFPSSLWKLSNLLIMVSKQMKIL